MLLFPVFPMNFQLISLHRHEDKRGVALNPFDEILESYGDIQKFHACSLKKGAVRGNHYHENLEEYILFLGCNFRLLTEDIASQKRQEHYSKGQDGQLIKINRKVAHAIKNEGEETLYILCFYLSKDPVAVETAKHQLL